MVPILRPLTPADFEAVVELDRQITGSPRRAWFTHRLNAAVARPTRHIQLAAEVEDVLLGFVLARVVSGEYGRDEPLLVLEAIAIAPSARHASLGQRMMRELLDLPRVRNLSDIVTQVDWRDSAMTTFLDRAGFLRSPFQAMERRVARLPLPDTDEAIEATPPLVRCMRPDDLAAIERIDFRITAQHRGEYLARKVDEALRESAIAVSLCVEEDGNVVGFITARVDFGGFGKILPAASLDTVGVDPRFTRKGYAAALLSQLIENLAVLDVDTLETEVSYDNFRLLPFLCQFGFAPCSRLIVARKIQSQVPR